jgi:S1-C subfamily serine protease
MRTLLLITLASTTLATQAAAQRAGGRVQVRTRCQDCDTLSRDSIVDRVVFVREIERLAREVLAGKAVQLDLNRRLQETITRAQAEQNVTEAQIRVAARTLEAQLARQNITVSHLRNQLSAMCRRSPRPTGWLGVSFSSRDPERGRDGIEYYRFDDYPLIETVEPGSPAEQAGIEAGDVLVEIAGQDVRNQRIAFSTILKPGARLPLRMRRGVRLLSSTVVVGRRPEQLSGSCPWLDQRIAGALMETPLQFSFNYVRPGRVDGRGPESPEPARVLVLPRAGNRSEAAPVPTTPPIIVGPGVVSYVLDGEAVAGAQLVPLDNEGLREAIGVERGIFVVRVAPATPAARAGLRPGDVIIEVESREVTSVRTFARAMREAEEEKAVTLSVLRKGKPVEIVVKWDSQR